MADNVAVTAGSGTTIAADEVIDGTLGTVKVQYVKLMDGTLDGTTKAAVGAAGLKVDLSGTAANATAVKVDGSAVTQPVSAVSLPLPTGASTEATLSALNTKVNTEITADYDTGAGTQTMKLVGVALPASGGAVAGGTSTNPIQVSLANTAANATAVKVDGSAVVQPASQSGTWTVQPGNTANTTAWKVQLYDGVTNLPILAGSSGAPAASAPALAVSVRDANANGQATMANSAPVTIASDQSAVSVKPTAATTGGATPSKAFSAATTNATNLKASAGTLYGLTAINTTATVYYLKLYDKATAPTVGTDVPKLVFPIPPNNSGVSPNFPPCGAVFSAGIGWALTAAQADADTGVAATGVTINFFSA